MKTQPIDALSCILQHFDIDIHTEGHGLRTFYYVRLWEEGNDQGEVHAPSLEQAFELATEQAKKILLGSLDKPEPEKPTGVHISYFGLSPMQVGRLDKALTRVFRFKLGTMSLGDYLQQVKGWDWKTTTTRTHANKRTNLEYKQLKNPKTTYTIWHKDGWGTDIPKIVYDALAEIPEPAS